MIVTCHCFFHPAKKVRSGAIVRFSDNSSLTLYMYVLHVNVCVQTMSLFSVLTRYMFVQIGGS